MSLNSLKLPKIGLLIFCYFLIAVSCKETSDQKTDEKYNSTEAAVDENNPIILFFGNSLTAGMGLDPNEAFPALIQKKIDSLGYKYTVVNAGLSGDTTASGKNRLGWAMSKDVEIMILELGANDGLRGIPLSETKANLEEMISTAREKNPDIRIILAGMQIPPNMGPEYTSEFRNLYPQLAAENTVELIPFLLQNVAGIPELNQNDGIHPTEEGQKILANNVWEVLKSELN